MKWIVDYLRTVLGYVAMLLAHLFYDLGLRLVIGPIGSRPLFCRYARGVAWTGLGLMRLFWGFRLRIEGELPATVATRPFIVVANHSSPADIAVLVHLFELRHPIWVARAGLGRGIPYYSYALRRFNGFLLRRGQRAENLAGLRKLGERLEREHLGAVIFPEGRKTADSYRQLAAFRRDGLEALLAGAPTAVVVPIAILGTGDFYTSPWRPVRLGVQATLRVLPALDRTTHDAEIIDRCERAIGAALRAGGAGSTEPTLSTLTATPPGNDNR